MTIHQKIASGLALCLLFSGCRQQQNSTPRQTAASLTTGDNHTQPARQTLPPQPPVNYEADPVYQQGQTLSRSDIHTAMDQLEGAIAKAPDNPATAPYYLLLGRLKREFEGCQGDLTVSALSNPEKQCSGFVEYAKAHPTEYSYNEVGGNYLYGGLHFQELEKRYAGSPLAVEGAYELTKLSQGGECEGFLDCYIESEFSRVRDFLSRYPDTPHTTEAVKRADEAFRKTLWGDVWKTEWTEIKDPNKSSDYYDAANLKKLVQEYEDLAEKLPRHSRASSWETVAYYRNKFGEKDRARLLYERILKENPDFENRAEIQSRLAALK